MTHGTPSAYSHGCRCDDCRAANTRRGAEYRNRHREHIQAYERERNLTERYGITTKEYDALLVLQGGTCAICGGEPQVRRGERRFHVDHDHTTGAVRGLLCGRCNSGLGFFNDDQGLLVKAWEYMEWVA